VARSLKLLHIEDDRIQRSLIAHHLGAMKDCEVTIVSAESENEAMKIFGQGGFEFVILDYHLIQGNGLSCLHQIRRRDPLIPIVAISGEATPEIAAELVQVGADDYISKEELTCKHLTQSMRHALARADALRLYEPLDANHSHEVDRLFQQICQEFLASAGSEFLARLEEFEAAARHAQLTPGQIQRLFHRVANQGHFMASGDGLFAKILLRPILLEVLLRLFGQSLSPSSIE